MIKNDKTMIKLIMKDKLDKKDNYLSYVYLLSCFYHRKINKIIQNKKDKIDKLDKLDKIDKKNINQDKKKIIIIGCWWKKYLKMKMFYFYSTGSMYISLQKHSGSFVVRWDKEPQTQGFLYNNIEQTGFGRTIYTISFFLTPTFLLSFLVR